MRLLNTIVCVGLIACIPQPILAQDSKTPQFVADADRSADRWVRDNPTGLAIAISLGAATEVPVSTVERALRADFSARGISHVRFFYERGGDGGSSVIYMTRNHTWGPFGLAESRAQVVEAADQHLFELERGLH